MHAMFTCLVCMLLGEQRGERSAKLGHVLHAKKTASSRGSLVILPILWYDWSADSISKSN